MIIVPAANTNSGPSKNEILINSLESEQEAIMETLAKRTDLDPIVERLVVINQQLEKLYDYEGETVFEKTIGFILLGAVLLFVAFGASMIIADIFNICTF